MNKDVLVALIAKDVNELQTLTEGLDQMEMIPAPYLRLALDKSKALTANIESLVNYLDNKEIEDKQEAQRQVELEAKQAEEAAREAELARIAEEQEALFKAEELERQRREEERRKAEIEIARQVAAIEAARQLELEEKRRREEEARLQAELEEKRRREEEARLQVELEEKRRREEEARLQAELEEKRRREEEARLQAELEEKRRQEEEARRIAIEQDVARRREEEARRKAELENRARIHDEQPIDSIVSIEPIASISSVTPIESPVTTLADSIETAESLADKLAKNADDTLASALNSKKIIDLKSSITLGDRFRFQRELFGGNGEKMNKAISDFNSFETMIEAQEYIAKNFDWQLDNDAVSDFIQLLQRRYL